MRMKYTHIITYKELTCRCVCIVPSVCYLCMSPFFHWLWMLPGASGGGILFFIGIPLQMEARRARAAGGAPVSKRQRRRRQRLQQ